MQLINPIMRPFSETFAVDIKSDGMPKERQVFNNYYLFSIE
jgi:hypothetical protein